MESDAKQQGRARVETPFIPNDYRHSYIPRPQATLAGPGAYVIPSTFRRHSAVNTLLRAVQREHYGREFARMKRNASASSTDAIDTMDDIGADDVPQPPDANNLSEYVNGPMALHRHTASGKGARVNMFNERITGRDGRCGAVTTGVGQPSGVTTDKYRRRRDQLRSQVVRHVALPVSVPASPLPGGNASCYDAFVDGYAPAGGVEGGEEETPAVVPPPPPMQRLVLSRGREDDRPKLTGRCRGHDHTRGAYDRYLASTGYVKRVTRHRQRCPSD